MERLRRSDVKFPARSKVVSNRIFVFIEIKIKIIVKIKRKNAQV